MPGPQCSFCVSDPLGFPGPEFLREEFVFLDITYMKIWYKCTHNIYTVCIYVDFVLSCVIILYHVLLNQLCHMMLCYVYTMAQHFGCQRKPQICSFVFSIPYSTNLEQRTSRWPSISRASPWIEINCIRKVMILILVFYKSTGVMCISFWRPKYLPWINFRRDYWLLLVIGDSQMWSWPLLHPFTFLIMYMSHK